MEIIFGSMRMSEKSRPIEYWVHFFKHMHDRGIVQHHVSIEYDSFELYATVFKAFKLKYPDCTLIPICKIGEPSYNDQNFSRSRFIEKCADYCTQLNINTINVQWMSRLFLTDNTQRRTHLSEISSEFNDVIKSLQKDNKILNYCIFPYSVNDLQLYLEEQQYSPDYYMTYFNIIENQFEIILQKYNSNNNVAIRPFMAKKILDNYSLKEALLKIIESGAFNSFVVSLSNKKQIDEIISCLH